MNRVRYASLIEMLKGVPDDEIQKTKFNGKMNQIKIDTANSTAM